MNSVENDSDLLEYYYKKHHLMFLKTARESEESFIKYINEHDFSNYYPYDEYLHPRDIALLYDYDKAFELLYKGKNLYGTADDIIHYNPRGCMKYFGDKYGYDILLTEAVVYENNYKIAKYCLENGANPNTKYSGLGANPNTKEGTPIIFYASYDNFCLLINYGYNPKETDIYCKTIIEHILRAYNDIFSNHYCGLRDYRYDVYFINEHQDKQEISKMVLKLLKSDYEIPEKYLNWIADSEVPEIRELVELRLKK